VVPVRNPPGHQPYQIEALWYQTVVQEEKEGQGQRVCYVYYYYYYYYYYYHYLPSFSPVAYDPTDCCLR